MKKRVLKPEENRKNATAQQNEKYCSILKQMVDCKTIHAPTDENKEEFLKFYRVLEENFPLLHEKAERLTFGGGCFVYRIQGENPRKRVMLMSHHDVVEGTEGWDTDPFCATVKDGALYGRGTIDTKTPLFAQLQACEELLEQGFDFAGLELFIGSSHNEEVSGDGMVLAAEYFRSQGIHLDVILDEGGAITSGMIPGVTGKSAMVAVHEKSRHVYRCVAKQGDKGHTGLTPNDDSVVARMAGFIREVTDSKIYKGRFYPEIKGMFQNHAPYMTFPMNLLFGNLDLFAPIIKKIMLGIPQTKAMLSTGVTFTSVFAGNPDAPQFRAKEAETTMFLRCVREDDLYEGLEKIRAIGKKYGVEIEETLRDYCEPTDHTAPAFRQLEQVMAENFPDVVVAPFLLTAGTDARRFTGLADNILRFAPIDLDKAQFASIHGDNEHIKIQNIGQCVRFYADYIRAVR